MSLFSDTKYETVNKTADTIIAGNESCIFSSSFERKTKKKKEFTKKKEFK